MRKMMLIAMLFVQQSYAMDQHLFRFIMAQAMLHENVRIEESQKSKHSAVPCMPRVQKLQKFPKNVKYAIKQPRPGF